MLIIARNELYRLFSSPLAWLMLAMTQLILAYLFLSHIDAFIAIQGKTSLIPGAPGATELIVTAFFSNVALFLFALTPLLTMRLIADEQYSQTFPLLLTAPLSSTQIVVGKFISTFVFLFILLSFISLMPLSLTLGTTLDYGLIASGIVALLLLMASFTAIGLFFSSLTKQPIIAGLSTFSLLFLFWNIDWAGTAQLSDGSTSFFYWLSLLRHFETLLHGHIASSDVLYYLIITAFFISLTIRRLDSARLT